MVIFSLLWYYNRYINALEALGGSASLAEGLPRNTSLWDDALDALVIGINQVSFSGWKPTECTAIVNELLSWKQKGLSEFEGTISPLNMSCMNVHPYFCSHCCEECPSTAFVMYIIGSEDGKYIWALRLKATLDRTGRLTEEYSEALLSIFPEKVKVSVLNEE